MNRIYLDTARLLTQVAPFVFASGEFALKGGTAKWWQLRMSMASETAGSRLAVAIRAALRIDCDC